MKIIIKQGENGYDILTPYCVPFDLADVEVWLYLLVNQSVADLLVRGFPIFWEERGLADEQNDDSEKLAEKHRVDALRKLAKLDLSHLSGDAPNPFLELLRQREEVAEGGPQKPPTDNFFAGTELEEWTEQLQQKKRKGLLKSLEVPFAEWSKTACTFFDLLHEQPANRHVPSALQGTVKQRQQRTGELPSERGTRFVEQSELEPFFSRSDTNCIQWGPLYYETELVNVSHFCVAGMPQMGKTTLLRLLFQSLYRQPTGQARFVLYDAKADLLPVIYPPTYFEVERTQEEIDSEYYLLNPLDERCTGWDIALDASNTEDAAEVAGLLFPHESNSPVEKHYARSCRNIAVAVMEALTLEANGPHWTFYDLLCALQMENLETVLSTTQRGQQTYQKYLSGTGAAGNEPFVALANKTEHLLSAAYQWRKAKGKPLSLRAWVNSDPKSIVLMSHKKNANALTDINRLLLGLLCQNLFSDDEQTPRTYLYLDEFEQLGRIDSIIKASQQGASKKVNVAMCLHDIGLLRRAYKDETQGLLSMCGFFAFLKTTGATTAKWASEHLGNLEKERLSRTTTYSHDDDGDDRAASQHSTTASRQSLPNVLPDEIKGLPTPQTSNQVTGYYVAPPHPRYRGRLPLADLYPSIAANSGDLNSLWPASPRVKKFIGPTKALTPPADTFLTLHQLGFPKFGYEPPEEEPEPVERQSVVANDQVTEEKTAAEKKKVRKRTNVTFDFGLDD